MLAFWGDFYKKNDHDVALLTMVENGVAQVSGQGSYLNVY